VVHAAAEDLRKQRPSLFFDDENVIAAQGAGGTGTGAGGVEAVVARVESLEREVRAGMAGIRGDIAAISAALKMPT
jgi:hypothetical protein